MGKYDEIMHMSRPVSKAHPPMDRAARAKQFMPFAALTGFGDVLSEKERIFIRCPVPGEDERARTDEALRLTADLLDRGETPRVRLKYFLPMGPADEDGAPLGIVRDAEGTADKMNGGRLRVDGVWYPLEALTGLNIAMDSAPDAGDGP